MPTENRARAEQPQPDAPDEGDYQALCSALTASARGRAFLAEYVKRNHRPDVEPMRAALDRLHRLAAANAAQPAPSPTREDLHELIAAIRSAKAELEASAVKVGKLTELIAVIERRVVASEEASAGPQGDAAAAGLSDTPAENTARAHLAVVPLPEQPELPIPSPATTPPPPIALVRRETKIAEVAFVEWPPTPATQDAKPVAAEVNPAARSGDPLASIMALSEEERLALFT